MGFLKNLTKSGAFGGMPAALGWLSGDEEEPQEIPRPEYFEDKDYRITQDFLRDYGMGILKGDIPDYYKPIGEAGGKEFEDMLALTKQGITQSTAEAMAKGARARGGGLAAATAPAIAGAETKARYADYERSLVGKQNLMRTGVGVTEGVRRAGQVEGGNVNRFNWQDYQAQVGERRYQDMVVAEQDAQMGEMIGTIASVGVGGAVGFMTGGPVGAAIGAGSALAGQDLSFLSKLGKIKPTSKKTTSTQDVRDYYSNPSNRL